MKTFYIWLHSVEDVHSFVSLASVQSFPISVGSDEFLVNGKSFMSMFCLDQRRPQQVRMDCGDEEFCRFRHEAEHFLVK